MKKFKYNQETMSSTDAKEMAQHISEQNVIAIYQGKYEAGPRALGNRSFLYDPRDPKGKEKVNKIKQRQWYRPFAASVMLEHAHDWFEMLTLKESPYMMYAVEIKEDKRELIPAVTHVDNTCRIQTVTREQNPHFYDLINEFYKLTGIPMLFNTSFNLANEPICNIEIRAVDMAERAGIQYLYFPEEQIKYETYDHRAKLVEEEIKKKQEEKESK